MGLKEEFILKLKMNPSDYILEKVMSFELLCLIFKVWVCTEDKEMEMLFWFYQGEWKVDVWIHDRLERCCLFLELGLVKLLLNPK